MLKDSLKLLTKRVPTCEIEFELEIESEEKSLAKTQINKLEIPLLISYNTKVHKEGTKFYIEKMEY